MRPILDTHQSWTAILDRQRFWTHTNRTPIGTGPQSERPILDAHQSEPHVIQEVIQDRQDSRVINPGHIKSWTSNPG